MSTDQRLAALWSPAFRRYLIGQVPSVTCSWIQVVALATVVVQIDAPALGWVVALQFLPSLVFGPWCGALVDRHDRRRLLMMAEAGLGLVAAALAVASLVDGPSLGLICGLATVWGLFNALDTPARRALIPMLVAPVHAARASSLAATGMLIGMASGSALGAVLVAHAGPTIAFGVNALSFAADVAILASIRVAPAPRVPRSRGQIRAGLRYVLRTRELRDPLMQLAVVATLGFGVQVSVPVYVRSILDGGPALIGAALTAVTVGSLVGALAAVARGAPGPATTSRTTLAMALALTTTAVAPNAVFAFIGFAGIGLTWSLLLAMVVARLQQADAAMMGRVMSLFATVLIGGMAIGGPVVSTEVAYAGARAPFLIGAGAAVLAVGLVLATRPASRTAVPADR